MSGKPMSEMCENCRYWNPCPNDGEEAEIGECRKLPPIIVEGLINLHDEDAEYETYTALSCLTHFPVTWFETWCGAYEAKKPEKD